MSEANRRTIELIEWFAANVDRPSIEVWERLLQFAPIDKKALARRKRNQRAYQKAKGKKEQSVLNGLNDRLKASEKSEYVLINGKFLIMKGTPEHDAWSRSLRAQGKLVPESGQLGGGWLFDTPFPPGHRSAA